MSAASWRREERGRVVLSLSVHPGAKRTGVDGVHGEGTQMRLKIRVAAPPTDGKANAALLRFLADAFHVPLRNVTLVHGEASRQKIVRVEAPVRRPDWFDS